MNRDTKIIAVAGKGGVGKTSISAAFVRLLTEAYPDKRKMCIRDRVKLAVTSDMQPNAYIYITLLQPHGVTKNDLPIRMYGVEMCIRDRFRIC